MSGFDPSKFLAPELPLDDGAPAPQDGARSGVASPGQGAGSSPLSAEPAARSSRQSEGKPAGSPSEPLGKWSDAAPPSPPVAGVAAQRRNEGGLLIDEETGEILDGWATDGGSVAGVAGVAATHDLPLTAPFARELNAMFSYPEPAWMKRGAWKRLCEAVRKFTEAKAADALAMGWEPIELFGVHCHPWKRSLAVDGVLWLAHGRGIGLVEPHAIEIINKHPPNNRAYRAHFMACRVRSALMWEAFHPSNRRPDKNGQR